MSRGVFRSFVLFSSVLPFLFARDAAAQRSSPLKQKLDSIASAFHGTLGYSVHNLKTGERLERLGDSVFPSASTIKLAILVEAMDQQQRGTLDYDAELPFTEQDRQYGTGVIANFRSGGKIPVRQLVHFMIAQSDNTATIMLGQKLGSAAINDWLTSHGFKKTRLLVPFPYKGSFDQAGAAGGPAWDDVRKWGMGVTTPNEMRTLMEMIAAGRAGSPAASDEMQRILNHQYYDDGIASQVPPSIAVGSKHGSEDRSRSDVAVVHSPGGDYALAIYTNDAKDTGVKWDNEQDSAIRAISRAVFVQYNPQVRWGPPAGYEKLLQFQTEPCYPGMPCWKGPPPGPPPK
jgi:beta-lactamase class A